MSVLSTSYLVCIRSNFVHSSAGAVTFHEAMGPCASPQGGQRTSLSWSRELLVATLAELLQYGRHFPPLSHPSEHVSRTNLFFLQLWLCSKDSSS